MTRLCIDLRKNWCDFIEKYKDYLKEDTILIERSYADPSVTNIDKCLYDICMPAILSKLKC